MKSKKKVFLLIGSALMALIVIIISASYVLASSNASNKYPEPAIRPAGLPPTAQFNPDTNQYYDSSVVKWDSVNQRYVQIEQPVVSNTSAENIQVPSKEDWIVQHENSTNPTDIALIKYQQTIEAYDNAHPEVSLSSDWGVDNGGALSILTGLGVAGLPGLVAELNDVNNPFIVPLIFAIEAICKTDISFCDTFSPAEVTAWKNALNDESNNAKNIVANVVTTLKNNPSANADDINNQLADAGIFSLPYVYNEVINNSNVSLLKYVAQIMPDELLQEFNIGVGAQDSGAYLKALENSGNDINIINSLKVN
ncbi:MAG: hypothetical protein WBQ62_04750 [Dehalococcoidales bacterium]|jgi:hypothetical protein